MNGDDVFTITLTLNELNAMAGLLADGPFKIAAPLISKIDEQIKQQSDQRTEG